jgi:hypothetical protein
MSNTGFTLIHFHKNRVERQADWMADINEVLGYAVAVEMKWRDDDTLEIFALVDFNTYQGEIIR